MPADLPIGATSERICGILDELGIIYALCGGLGAIFYGESRLTQDVDIALEMRPDALPSLLTRLEPYYYFDSESAEKAVRTRDMFQALDKESFIKVDLHLGGGIAGELQRAVRVQMFSEREICLLCKEDMILSKLRWISLGSAKNRQDVVAMLLDPQPVDMEFVRTTAREMGSEALLDELRTEAERLVAD